jgi:hypothetical protein
LCGGGVWDAALVVDGDVEGDRAADGFTVLQEFQEHGVGVMTAFVRDAGSEGKIQRDQGVPLDAIDELGSRHVKDRFRSSVSHFSIGGYDRIRAGDIETVFSIFQEMDFSGVVMLKGGYGFFPAHTEGAIVAWRRWRFLRR